MPGADAVRAIDAGTARREIRAQATDFDAYRRGLAGSFCCARRAEASLEARCLIANGFLGLLRRRDPPQSRVQRCVRGREREFAPGAHRDAPGAVELH